MVRLNPFYKAAVHAFFAPGIAHAHRLNRDHTQTAAYRKKQIGMILFCSTSQNLGARCEVTIPIISIKGT
jgi:hypothetical protein